MKLRGTKYIVGFLAGSIIFGGGAYALNVANTPETGYLVCVNAKTKVVTYPGTLKCPKGNKVLQLGAQGLQGLPGPSGSPGVAGQTGPSGAPGAPGQSSSLNLYDANGALLGPVIGTYIIGSVGNGTATALVAGSGITYNLAEGKVSNILGDGFTTGPYYTTATCTGSQYVYYQGSNYFSLNRVSSFLPIVLPSTDLSGNLTGSYNLALPYGPADHIAGGVMYARSLTTGTGPCVPQTYAGTEWFFRVKTIGTVNDAVAPLSIR